MEVSEGRYTQAEHCLVASVSVSSGLCVFACWFSANKCNELCSHPVHSKEHCYAQPETFYIHRTGFSPERFCTKKLLHQRTFAPKALYTRKPFTPKTKAFTPHVCTLEHQIQKPFTPKISRKHFITNHFTPETFHTRRLFYDMAITPEAIHTRRLLQKTPFAPPALPQQNEAKAFYIRSPTMQNAIEKWHIHCNPGENRLIQNQPWEGQQWHPAPTQPCDALNT